MTAAKTKTRGEGDMAVLRAHRSQYWVIFVCVCFLCVLHFSERRLLKCVLFIRLLFDFHRCIICGPHCVLYYKSAGAKPLHQSSLYTSNTKSHPAAVRKAQAFEDESCHDNGKFMCNINADRYISMIPPRVKTQNTYGQDAIMIASTLVDRRILHLPGIFARTMHDVKFVI